MGKFRKFMQILNFFLLKSCFPEEFLNKFENSLLSRAIRQFHQLAFVLCISDWGPGTLWLGVPSPPPKKMSAE